jgi:hypothetical protein
MPLSYLVRLGSYNWGSSWHASLLVSWSEHASIVAKHQLGFHVAIIVPHYPIKNWCSLSHRLITLKAPLVLFLFLKILCLAFRGGKCGFRDVISSLHLLAFK